MLLIDAAKTSSGGALVILKLLLEKLQATNKKFFLIKDPRWHEEYAYKLPHYEGKSMTFNRGKTLKHHLKKLNATALLCFYSFPPPINVSNDTKVYTYFQNPNLLDVFYDKNVYSKSQNIIWFLKKRYLRTYLDNTDYFIFQTKFIVDSFVQQYGFDRTRCLLYPYYDEQKIDAMVANIQQEKTSTYSFDFCYISLPYPHKNHINLIKAFMRLKEKYGETPSLVLTAPESYNAELNLLIQKAISAGVQLTNVGLVPLEKALYYTRQSKFYIFPSRRETLGLGLVEACKMDKPVITSDIPIIQDVITPSATFDADSVEGIMEQVHFALHHSLQPGTLQLENKLDEFVKLLYN